MNRKRVNGDWIALTRKLTSGFCFSALKNNSISQRSARLIVSQFIALESGVCQLAEQHHQLRPATKAFIPFFGIVFLHQGSDSVREKC
jgi:hypothetical protein